LIDRKSGFFLTPNEVAALLRVSPITVRQWAQKGELPAELTPGGHRRFDARAVEAFAQQRKISLAQRRGGAHKILIVDDDVTFAEYLCELLGGVPDDIRTAKAHDGFEAGRMMHTFKPDIMLLDLRMPRLNGLQVCLQIKADPQLADVRIIAMTGYADAEQIREVLRAGAECCLTKPFGIKKLTTALALTVTKPHKPPRHIPCGS